MFIEIVIHIKKCFCHNPVGTFSLLMQETLPAGLGCSSNKPNKENLYYVVYQTDLVLHSHSAMQQSSFFLCYNLSSVKYWKQTPNHFCLWFNFQPKSQMDYINENNVQARNVKIKQGKRCSHWGCTVRVSCTGIVGQTEQHFLVLHDTIYRFTMSPDLLS